MKIMYLLFSFTVGGTERLVADICNQMLRQGNEVYLYIVNNVYSQQMLETLDERMHIELQKRNPSAGSKLKTVIRVADYIKTNKIQVVHCNSFNAPELLILKSILFHNVRICHTIHGIGQYRTLNKIQVIYRNFLCDCFVAVSESTKRDIIRYGANAKKVITIYNAIDFKKFTTQNNRKVFERNHLVIGNVARIQPKIKGQDVLVRAVAILKESYPHIKCLFAGAADQANQKDFNQLEGMVQKLRLTENIAFLGNVDDISEFLTSIDVFVLPSRTEGFGISLIEAMAMGVPCIASNLDGPAEIMREVPSGILFEPGNPEELAEKISMVIEHYTEYKMKAASHVALVRDRYNIENMCLRLLDVYSKM